MEYYRAFRASFEDLVYQQYYYREYLRYSERKSNYATWLTTIATSGCVWALINDSGKNSFTVPCIGLEINPSIILSAIVFLAQLINMILPTFHWEKQIALTNLAIPELENLMYQMGSELGTIIDKNDLEHTTRRIRYYEYAFNSIIHHYIPNEMFPDRGSCAKKAASQRDTFLEKYREENYFNEEEQEKCLNTTSR